MFVIRKTHFSWLRCCLLKLIWLTSESMCLARIWRSVETITALSHISISQWIICFICNVLLVISLYSIIIVVMKYGGRKCMHNILEANYNSNSSVTSAIQKKDQFSCIFNWKNRKSKCRVLVGYLSSWDFYFRQIMDIQIEGV